MPATIKRNVQVTFTPEEFRLVQQEAARRGLYMKQLVREWLEPGLKRLREQTK